jgi:hypothetical protein
MSLLRGVGWFRLVVTLQSIYIYICYLHRFEQKLKEITRVHTRHIHTIYLLVSLLLTHSSLF